MNAMRDWSLRKARFQLNRLILAAGCVLMASSMVRAETWCLRDVGRDTGVCVFNSAQQCTSAAVIGGGICERESLRRATDAKPCRQPRETRAIKGRHPIGANACDAS